MSWRRVLLVTAALLSPTLCLRAGGPDEAGYRWIDSDAVGGPAFNWIEISSQGTQIHLGDDDNLGPFPLGFDFTYYGLTYDSIRVCSNGWVSFTSRSHQFHCFPIPSPEEPNGLLAPFWFDLDPSAGGAVYYHADTTDSQFVVAWYGVPPHGGSGGYTFQTVLMGDGTVLFQYKRMQGSAGVESTSVGVENQNGFIGLQYLYNGSPVENLLHDSLVVKFYQLDHDVMPILIHSPLETVFPSAEVFPRVTVKNYGKSQETFGVQCEISDSLSGAVVYEDSATVTGLPYLGEAFVEFTSPWTPDQGTYEVDFLTLLPGDEDPSNDTLERYTACSYRGEMAYDDGSAENFRYVGGSPSVHWATAVRFTPPFSPYLVLSGKVFVEDTSPFEEMLVCPDSAGVPDVEHPYCREESVSAPSPHDWACASFYTLVNSMDDIWLVAVWPLAATTPKVGEDIHPPIDQRSCYGIPGVYWNPWAAGDWLMRVEIDGAIGVEETPEARCRPSSSLGTGIQDARLMQNFPNPFTTSTTIELQVKSEKSKVSLKVYDLGGRLVRTLLDEPLATDHLRPDSGLIDSGGGSIRPTTAVSWDGRDNSGVEVPSGLYLCTLNVDSSRVSRKMVLLR